jgi:hypothetical protein
MSLLELKIVEDEKDKVEELLSIDVEVEVLPTPV